MTIPSPKLRRLQEQFLTLTLVALAFLPCRGMAWGEPHLAITKAAIEVLPPWQKELLGAELAPLGDYYCTIPDKVYTDIANAKFAMMDTLPGKAYVLKLHLPAADQPENLETLRYFIGKAVDSLKAGEVGNAARFMGTICHLLEDFGSPAHTIPGDNMFTLFQQFMPPPEAMKGKLLHSLIENGELDVVIKDYRPRLLGVTVDEAAWRLLHRVHEGILNARTTTIPIIQALYADDAKVVTSQQMKAATVDAQVVADALHTILCLGAARFEDGDRDSLGAVGIATHFPLEAVNLYFPQTHFFSSPYWGYARTGVALDGGTKPVPLKLRIPEGDKEFADGISTGMGKALTYLLPPGVYRQFTVLAGLHPELGAKGKVEFKILGDGKLLTSAIISGSDLAQTLQCDVTGVTQLQLSATTSGSDSKSNYAIWAEPQLLKSGAK
jgi:hypothetical protein